jgi:hypothetical protein
VAATRQKKQEEEKEKKRGHTVGSAYWEGESYCKTTTHFERLQGKRSHIGTFLSFRGVRCCHHKLVPPSRIKWKAPQCDHDGKKCEINSFTPLLHQRFRSFPHPSDVLSATNRIWEGRSPPAASGEMCLFRELLRLLAHFCADPHPPHTVPS